MRSQTAKIAIVSSLFMSMMPMLLWGKGVSLDATRIIYPQGEKSVSVTIKNSDPQVTYLSRSFIADEREKPNKSFEVTPPVFKITPGMKQDVRIISKNSALPADRETLFYFHTTMIAGQNEQVEGDALNIGYDHVLKMFYRPKNLGMTSAKAQESLKFSVKGSALNVSNDSPYYINLAQIKINNQRIDMSMAKGNTMIPPFSSISYPLSSSVKTGMVTWRVITDLGGTNEFNIKI